MSEAKVNLSNVPKLPNGDFVHVVYPLDGTVAAVPKVGLGHYYAGGWRLLVADDIPADKPLNEPRPVTVSEAAKAQAKAEK